MEWFRTFPYKLQVAEIALGLCCIVSGAIFSLIAVGISSPLWRIMAGTTLCIGIVCTIMGSIWCCWLVKRARLHGEIYCKTRDCEAETMTSEATEMIRWLPLELFYPFKDIATANDSSLIVLMAIICPWIYHQKYTQYHRLANTLRRWHYVESAYLFA